MLTKTTLIIIAFFTTSSLWGQLNTPKKLDNKFFIGSTAFILANFADDSPNYYQLNFGYRITPKDIVSIEAITWEYKGPLGRPFSEQENESSNYPGSVKAVGFGLAYKRFIWKDMYTAFHATILQQNYLDKKNKKIQSGYQLFNSLRLGYQFKFFKNSFFLEPSLAITFWPINTNLPSSFQVEEDKWNNYFLFEPGLHFGINF